MLKECYDEALSMLRENRDVMDKIAAHLIEKETITGKEFMKIYREAKGLPEPEEKKDESGDKADIEIKAEETKEPETQPTEETKVPSPEELRNVNPQQQALEQPQNSGWSMPPAYDWNPAQAQNDARSQSQSQDNELPEDNGENGETSRFGSAWDRNVNGK